jgi:glycine betaine/choline ABC-type transport system substrate-binding protein
MIRHLAQRRRAPLTALLVIALGCAGLGCGEDTKENSEVTLTVSSRALAEEMVLGEIYAEALEAYGFDVRRNLGLPPGPPPLQRKGEPISGYPEHMGIALTDVAEIGRRAPGDRDKAYELAKESLEKKGMTAFPPAPFARELVAVMLRSAAEERGLRTLTDLKSQSDELSIWGGKYCLFAAKCVGGLRSLYGMSFESFTGAEPKERFEALESGKADVAMLPNTEVRFARGQDKFVQLEDDKQLLPAGDALWVTTLDVADEAGPDYERAILAAQRGLTLEVMQRLHAEVQLDRKPLRKVAARYLRSLNPPPGPPRQPR